MRGTPQNMQSGDIVYNDVVQEVYDFLKGRISDITSQGVSLNKIIVDPGIGFGKTLKHNLLLSQNLLKFQKLASGVLYGPSKKNFLGEIVGIQNPSERGIATLGAVALSYSFGANIIRVHDVKNTVQVLKVVSKMQKWHGRDGNGKNLHKKW